MAARAGRRPTRRCDRKAISQTPATGDEVALSSDGSAGERAALEAFGTARDTPAGASHAASARPSFHTEENRATCVVVVAVAGRDTTRHGHVKSRARDCIASERSSRDENEATKQQRAISISRSLDLDLVRACCCCPLHDLHTCSLSLCLLVSLARARACRTRAASCIIRRRISRVRLPSRLLRRLE